MKDEQHWSAYFKAMAGKPPRETLLFALDRLDEEFGHAPNAAGNAMREACLCHPDAMGVALDLGCGDGRDTVEMLRRRWCVLAVDSHPEALARLQARVAAEIPAGAALLKTGLETFEDMPLPPDMFDLVNASFAIPHCRPEDFPAIWSRVTASVKPGGRLAGQLFGMNDEWARKPDGITRTYHTRAEVERLLTGFQTEKLEEVERPGKGPLGEDRYWHVFHIVAKKNTQIR